MASRSALVFALAVSLVFAGPAGAATIFGPSPYLCFNTATAPAGCGGADSPFKSLPFSSFFLETFEDHLLNVPGVTASAGGVTSVVFGPSIHDSVDADDGVIDGSGLLGDSFFAAGFPGITFTFSAAVLGALPTHAGIVWTDGAGTISFSASGPGGVLAPCSVTNFSIPGVVPDGSFNGETAEDRFFGCSDPGGISSISISNSAGGIEVDHLQYGLLGGGPGPSVPAPASLILLGSGLIGMTAARRLRRR